MLKQCWCVCFSHSLGEASKLQQEHHQARFLQQAWQKSLETQPAMSKLAGMNPLMHQHHPQGEHGLKQAAMEARASMTWSPFLFFELTLLYIHFD